MTSASVATGAGFSARASAVVIAAFSVRGADVFIHTRRWCSSADARAPSLRCRTRGPANLSDFLLHLCVKHLDIIYDRYGPAPIPFLGTSRGPSSVPTTDCRSPVPRTTEQTASRPRRPQYTSRTINAGKRSLKTRSRSAVARLGIADLASQPSLARSSSSPLCRHRHPFCDSRSPDRRISYVSTSARCRVAGTGFGAGAIPWHASREDGPQRRTPI
jgi:hypothetical protein